MAKHSLLPGISCLIGSTVFAVVFLRVEAQWAVLALTVAAVAALLVGERLGFADRVRGSFSSHAHLLGTLAFTSVLIIAAIFYDQSFPLLMLATLLIYLTVCLGLTVQMGYAGVVNFAGAAFFGVGSYTAAVLTRQTPAVPHLLVILLGGILAALIGSLLILPVLRTRGHYAALVTIAFGILFRTFLEVNDTLGGSQGLKVRGLKIFGYAFNDSINLPGEREASFYLHYVLFTLLLAAGAFVLVRRLERSWIGLNLDAVRLDETAAATFGLNVAWWKVVAFTFGNFLAGLAGATYGMMSGFVAPGNFTFSDSLILVSILILGGLGNPWGIIPAAAIVLLLPEKLQAIQEYRYLLYAVLVIIILLFRPSGLLPRRSREYFPGWKPG